MGRSNSWRINPFLYRQAETQPPRVAMTDGIFSKPAPELVQDGLKRCVVEVREALPTENHDVNGGQLPLTPEGFPDLALDAVSLDGQLKVFLGKHQADPGMTERVRRCQDQKVPMRNLQLYVIEDFAVIRGPQQTVSFRKTQSLHEQAGCYADRRARPLARRRDRTLRPLAVAIRARKPCTRLRFRTLG